MKVIEISIILIMVLLIFGVILTSAENSLDKVIKAQEINNMEKLTSEVIDDKIVAHIIGGYTARATPQMSV